MLFCLFLAPGCGGKSGGEQSSYGTVREIDVEKRTLVLREKLPSDHPSDEIRRYRIYKLAFDCKITTLAKDHADIRELKVGERIEVVFTPEKEAFVVVRIKPRGADTAGAGTE